MKSQPDHCARLYTIELTAKELSATIEAYNVVDRSTEGRPPLMGYYGPAQRKALTPHATSAWRKFIHAEGSGGSALDERRGDR